MAIQAPQQAQLVDSMWESRNPPKKRSEGCNPLQAKPFLRLVGPQNDGVLLVCPQSQSREAHRQPLKTKNTRRRLQQILLWWLPTERRSIPAKVTPGLFSLQHHPSKAHQAKMVSYNWGPPKWSYMMRFRCRFAFPTTQSVPSCLWNPPNGPSREERLLPFASAPSTKQSYFQQC